MVQLRGNCQPRKKKCFIASILKFVYLGALIYSWSIGFHIEWCPCCCNEACGTPSLCPASCRRALWSTAELPQAPMFYILEGWVTDGQGASFFFLARKSSCPFRVWATSVGGALLGWRLALPRGKAVCHCLGEKQTPPRGWEFRWVWVQIPVLPFPNSMTFGKIALKIPGSSSTMNRDDNNTHSLPKL